MKGDEAVKRSAWFDTLSILGGLAIMACAYTFFFIPNNLAPGGFTGAATVIHHLSAFPIGVMAFLLNAPLFLISWKYLGKAVFFRSIVAMTLLSVFVDTFPTVALVEDAMLAAIFGGVLQGLGVGLILRTTTTTGGSDMAGSLLHRAAPLVSTATWIFAIDFLIIIAAALVFDLTLALFSIIAAFVALKVTDWVLEGWGAAKAFTIITQKGQVISKEIMETIEHGVTRMQGTGMYSGREMDVLLCVVYRGDVVRLKRLVARHDPQAFVIVSNVTEAMGEGFHSADLP